MWASMSPRKTFYKCLGRTGEIFVRHDNIVKLISSSAIHRPFCTRGFPGEPSRLRLGCTLPNSRKMVKPYPAMSGYRRAISRTEKAAKVEESID
jgi:hypothetical protein